MTDIRFLYVTTPNYDDARKLAHKIVEERAATCANILPKVESVYWWKGNLETANECVVIFKTRADQVDEAMRSIRLWHSNSTPCIVSIPIEKADADYLDWLQGEVRR